MFDKQSVRRMELLILGGLNWRMRTITPFSFLSFFLSFFQLKDPPLTEALQARATQIIFDSQHGILSLYSIFRGYMFMPLHILRNYIFEIEKWITEI